MVNKTAPQQDTITQKATRTVSVSSSLGITGAFHCSEYATTGTGLLPTSPDECLKTFYCFKVFSNMLY
jgi:hypothetical protein